MTYLFRHQPPNSTQKLPISATGQFYYDPSLCIDVRGSRWRLANGDDIPTDFFVVHAREGDTVTYMVHDPKRGTTSHIMRCSLFHFADELASWGPRIKWVVLASTRFCEDMARLLVELTLE